MVKVPQYLSLPPRFAIFDQDDIVAAAIPICLGAFFRFSMLICALFSALLCVLYKRNKEKFSRGFLYHISYMLGASFKGFESVHTREYKE